AVVTAVVLGVTLAALALIAFGLFEFAWLSRWANRNIGLAVTIAFAVMWILMLAQVPLVAVMGLTGIVGSALFTGFAPAVSALATAATIGRVAIPEMRARGYSPALATGCCAAGGTLGPIVPRGSGPIIVHALLTVASIGQLFVASVGPAALTMLF